MKVDIDLVKKYNRPGPRYTSYPTAPHFHEGIKHAEWLAEIQKSNHTDTRNLSLYFHIPFCYTLCYYCGCTTSITKDAMKSEIYLNYLIKEMDLYLPHIHPNRRVAQLHWGGGTPTYLSPDQIRRLGDATLERFTFADDAEVGVEMDPRRLTHDHIMALRDVGFNRASLGVQDFDPVVQKAVNRINPLPMVQQTLEWIHKEDFHSVNIDLIYGLPHQTPDSFDKTLEEVIKLNPDRLAVFNFAYVPWLKTHQTLIKASDLPSPEAKLEMLKRIIETLTGAGYIYIGMDHFAKAGDELALAQKNKTLQRNFQGYSTQAGTDIYAFGMSSISQLEWAYGQNVKDLPDYYRMVDEKNLPIERGVILTPDDQERRTIITRLMCDLELDFANISAIIGKPFKENYQNELSKMDEFEADGLLLRESGKIHITEEGRLFIRNIAMVFDSYLKEGEQRFSKTI